MIPELYSWAAFVLVLVFMSIRSVQALRLSPEQEASRPSVFDPSYRWKQGVRKAVAAIATGVLMIVGAQAIFMTYLWVALGTCLILLGLFWTIICVKVLKHREPSKDAVDQGVAARGVRYHRRTAVGFGLVSLGWLVSGVIAIA